MAAPAERPATKTRFASPRGSAPLARPMSAVRSAPPPAGVPLWPGAGGGGAAWGGGVPPPPSPADDRARRIVSVTPRMGPLRVFNPAALSARSMVSWMFMAMALGTEVGWAGGGLRGFKFKSGVCFRRARARGSVCGWVESVEEGEMSEHAAGQRQPHGGTG